MANITYIRRNEQLYARIDNPRWNAALNERVRGMTGLKAYHTARRAFAKATGRKIGKARFQTLNGKWYAEIR